MDDQKHKSPALAAAIILIGFGTVAYFMPSIMLALGERSHIAAIIVSIVFVLGFFAIFWFRSRHQSRD